MFLKFQHFDAINCLHTLSSSQGTPNVNTRVSVTPTKKRNDHKSKGQQLLLESSKMGKNLGAKNGLIENPVGKSGKDEKFGVRSLPATGNNDGMENLHKHRNSAALDGNCGFRSHNGVAKNPHEKAEKSDNFGYQFRPHSGCGFGVNELHSHGSARLDGKNGAIVNNSDGRVDKILKFGVKYRPASSQKKGASKDQIGLTTSRDRKVKNKRDTGFKNNSAHLNGAVLEQVKTKCSTKWMKYGGCIPAILEALKSVSDLDEAFKPWEQSLSNKERSIILKEQAEWERAVEIFEWFKRKGCYEVNVIHYNIMLRILGKARRWDEVERLWIEMVERRIEPINSTYGTLIDVYSKGGLKEHAMKWLELMNNQGMEPDEVTMGIVVQMYKKMGEFKKAEDFFMKWSSGKFLAEGQGNSRLGHSRDINGETSPQVCLSSYTYNTLIDLYGKAGQVKEACETFEQMLREGNVPTTVTFNTMIHMRGNNGQLDEVSSLMKKMKDLKCLPDTRTYNILIFLHAQHDEIHTAVEYFNKMKETFLEPDVVSYRTLLYAFSIRHMVAEAEELISEMDRRGLDIDEFTQSALTRMYIEAGMVENSWLWFQRFHLKGNMTSECYSANIDAFAEHGHVLEAEKVFNCCRERSRLSVLEFNVMIKAYGISKKYDEACRLFESMEHLGVVPDRCSYNSLVQMLANADMPDKAVIYVRKMQQAGLVDDCVPYCAVISSFAKLGKLEMAVRLYNEMIGFDVQPDVVVYGVLINAFADTGSVKEADTYLDSMRSAGIQLNAVIYNSLIKLYTKVGYLEKAQQAYQTLQSFEVGPDVYSSNCMIDLYSKQSMVRKAEEIFEKLKRKQQANEFSYAMMLCMYRRNGRFAEAIQIAQSMRELGLMTDLLSYNNVLSLYSSDGIYKEAAEVFKEMLVSAIQPDDSTFKALGIVLLKCGVPKEAIGKLESLRKEDAQTGLQAWKSTLFSVINVSGNSYVDDGDA